MKKLYIYNTLGKQKQEFQSMNSDKVLMYHCGPTVYWTQHIGNLRAAFMSDLVVRILKYLDYNVKLVRNYTDVGHLTSDEDMGEDKIEKASKRESMSPEQIAQKYIDIFEKDIHALNISDANYKPRPTQLIPEIIEMIQTLIDKGFAYTTDLAVYFDIAKAKDYTRLSGQNLEENLAHAGSGDIADKNKKNPQDFALWFFKAGTHIHAIQTWPSPFESPLVKNGEGFPGWHIECSTMAKKYLGKTIDIHMGGIEHVPVHHTNEIAQSENANDAPLANYWLHNEHLTVDGEKMSKSEGTSYSLQEIVDKGFNPLALRYFFLQAHYRSKQNFTWKALEGAQNALNKLYLITLDFDEPKTGCAEFEEKFENAISDDFNTPQALAVMWDLLKSEYPTSTKAKTLFRFDEVLGLDIQIKTKEIKEKLKNIPQDVKQLLNDRETARKDKNWELSDNLREQIQKAGWWLEDTPNGTKILPK